MRVDVLDPAVAHGHQLRALLDEPRLGVVAPGGRDADRIDKKIELAQKA
jgi:hypothetical protein